MISLVHFILQALQCNKKVEIGTGNRLVIWLPARS